MYHQDFSIEQILFFIYSQDGVEYVLGLIW
jgi:hypothetical protein